MSHALDAFTLLALAQAETGLEDWSDPTFPDRLAQGVAHINSIPMDTAGRVAAIFTMSASVTVRRTQTGERRPVAFAFADKRTIRLLPEGTKPTIGSIYEVRYDATAPKPAGIGFAATRDIVSHLRRHGESLTGRRITHTLAFGISQAGRYLRDHIAQGFNADEDGGRVFDGVLTHVAGVGRVFHNTPFAQPFRTRTWHEDHDFPEIAFPFSAVAMDDPVTGASGALLRGDASDPKLIETNTSTEYWQKGASLLHTDPLTAYLATTPGGLDSVSIIALGSGSKIITLSNGTVGQPALHLNGTNGNILLPAGIDHVTASRCKGTAGWKVGKIRRTAWDRFQPAAAHRAMHGR